MITLFTQSYRESGFEGLTPLGFVMGRASYIDKNVEGINELIKNIEKSYEGIHFIFNCEFEWGFLGHPNNDHCKYVNMTGDAYRFPSNIELPSDIKEDLVAKDKNQHTRSVRIKKGWQLRCGLVQLEEEIVK